MNDLDTLRPEVREALIDFDSWMNSHEYHEGVRPRRWFKAIRAELLRLSRHAEFRDRQITETRKMLRTFNNHGDDRIQWDVNDAVQEVGALREAMDAYEADAVAYRDRIEKTEAELATAQNTINAQQDTMGALKRKLALSEGELAAMKARIDGSRHAFLGPNMDRITFLAEDIGPVGKYALVKVEE